jgi:hypothetical protein
VRYVFLTLAVVITSAVGFGAGFYYRGSQFPPSAQMEDYALTNLLENLGYASYLRDGKSANHHRELLNVAIEGHLTRMRQSQGASNDPEIPRGQGENAERGCEPLGARTAVHFCRVEGKSNE